MSIFGAHTAQAMSVIAAVTLAQHAEAWAADNSASPTPATSLGVTVTLPPLYEPTIQSVGALAATGATALKTYRSDARDQAIKAALTKALIGATPATIILDKANADPGLEEGAVLCVPRAGFASLAIYQSYLSTLVQNINAVSNKKMADSTTLDALKLLFASSSYAITDTVGIDAKTVAGIGAKNRAACESDLANYAKDYYGVELPAAHGAEESGSAAPGGGIDVSFFGPLGTLISTFVGIIQPVLTQAAAAVDRQQREDAIRTALVDNEAKVADAGDKLAKAIDGYVAAARHRAAGAFVEQLVSIRTTQIDLSKVDPCKVMKAENRSPSGARTLRLSRAGMPLGRSCSQRSTS